jgi:hypothetical protein
LSHRRNEKDAGLVFALALLLAAALMAIADRAGADEPAPCTTPADTPRCDKAVDGWQRCPVATLKAQGCEEDRLNKVLQATQAALEKANAATLKAAQDGEARAAWFKQESTEARRDLEGVRGLSRWTWGLAGGGVSVAAAGVAVLVDGRARDVGVGMAVAGVAAVVVGYVLTL